MRWQLRRIRSKPDEQGDETLRLESHGFLSYEGGNNPGSSSNASCDDADTRLPSAKTILLSAQCRNSTIEMRGGSVGTTNSLVFSKPQILPNQGMEAIFRIVSPEDPQDESQQWIVTVTTFPRPGFSNLRLLNPILAKGTNWQRSLMTADPQHFELLPSTK